MVKMVRGRPRRRRVARKPRRAPVRRMRVAKRTTDYAKVVEGFELPLTTNATGEFGFNFTTSLSLFNRAQEVAHAYKYYRCAKVELEMLPYANLSQVGGAANGRLPQLYFTVDRVCNQFIIPTEAELIERGIAAKIWNKKYKFSWKPNLLQNVQLETNQPAEGGGSPLGINVIGAVNSVPVFNKWLPTQQSYGFTALPGNAQIGQQMVQPAQNPYALRYYGAVFVISQEDGTAQQVGDLIVRVTWEFKGPRALKTNAPNPQEIVSPATSMMTPGVIANSQPTVYP